MFVRRFASVYIIISVVVELIQCTPIEISNDPQLFADAYTPIPILSQFDDVSPDGSFTYSFETGNHIKQQTNGYHKKVVVPRLSHDGTKTGELETADIIVQSGSYSYIAPDGQKILVQFIADENGFQAFGDHLPTPHPIPEQILHALQNTQNRQLEEQSAAHQFQDNANALPTETADSDEKQLLLPSYLQ